MGHTPSVPEVKQPASATDPRYSTSGILKSQIKEKNRQGLLSTYGGRTGAAMDINKYTEAKMEQRDSSAMPLLEKLAKLYASAGKNTENANAFNNNVNQINSLLSSYGQNSGLSSAQKETRMKKEYAGSGWSGPGTGGGSRYKRTTEEYVANADQLKQQVANLGKSGQQFNDIEAAAKRQKKTTK